MTVFVAEPFDPGLGGGLSLEQTVPGSAIAVPPGLESVLEYNGLLLNTQSSADRYHITSIDGLLDADVRDTRDPNPDDHGETPAAAYYGGRTIVIGGVIRTFSVGKLRDMQRALKRAFVDISQERRLHFRTGDFRNDVVIYCKKLAPISGIEQQANLSASREFQVSLRASNPRYLSYYVRSYRMRPPIPTESWQSAGSVESYGDFDAQPILRFYGPMSTVSLRNDSTGEILRVLGVGDGDYLEFNMANKSLKNSAGENKWSKFADVSDYMTIVPGLNWFSYIGDTPLITLKWHDSYL